MYYLLIFALACVALHACTMNSFYGCNRIYVCICIWICIFICMSPFPLVCLFWAAWPVWLLAVSPNLVSCPPPHYLLHKNNCTASQQCLQIHKCITTIVICEMCIETTAQPNKCSPSKQIVQYSQFLMFLYLHLHKNNCTASQQCKYSGTTVLALLLQVLLYLCTIMHVHNQSKCFAHAQIFKSSLSPAWKQLHNLPAIQIL